MRVTVSEMLLKQLLDLIKLSVLPDLLRHQEMGKLFLPITIIREERSFALRCYMRVQTNKCSGFLQ